MPDFFVISKVIPLLLYPLPLILLLIFILSWWLNKKSLRWIIRILTLALWLFSTPWTAQQLSQWWETPRTSRASLPPFSDVAVVLGGLSDPSGSTTEHLEFNRAAERLTEAVALYREGRVGALLITSGSGDLLNQEDKEAPGLAAWARAMGVPEEVVFVESESRYTRENATHSLPIAEKQGFQSFLLVTSASHMPRSAAIFKKGGYTENGKTLTLWPVDTQQSPVRFPFNAVPDPGSLTTSQSVLREAVGYAVYWVQGYL